MLNNYLSPGDIMQMYDDDRISIEDGIGHLTQHLFDKSKYKDGSIGEIEEEVLSLYSNFNSGCITGEEYLNDLYRLTLRN